MGKSQDKEFEEVEALGTDDEKEGVKAAKEIIPLQEKREVEKDTRTIEYLTNKRSRKIEYNRALAALLYSKLYEDEFPQNVLYEVIPTEEGVVMELTVGPRLFRQAFAVSGDPFYDLNAVKLFVMRAENTVEKICRN